MVHPPRRYYRRRKIDETGAMIDRYCQNSLALLDTVEAAKRSESSQPPAAPEPTPT
jgi:hypothetical protein